MSSSDSFAVDFSWDVSWPLYVVFPLSTLFFAAFYLLGPRIWPHTPIRKEYERFSELNKKCWRQNCCAMVHSVVVTLLLVVAIATDQELRDERPLHPHHNLMGHTALAFSLGYFSFAIPWTYHLYFCKGERHATNMALVIHHGVVWIGAFSYLVGETCALYGAVAFACMEFTNWFFIIHICLMMLRSKREVLKQVNYICLVVAFGICRLGICTWVGVLFSVDLSRFSSDSGLEWAIVLLQYTIFAFVWALSWYFVYNELKPAVKPLIEARIDAWRLARKAKQAERSSSTEVSKPPPSAATAADGLKVENV